MLTGVQATDEPVAVSRRKVFRYQVVVAIINTYPDQGNTIFVSIQGAVQVIVDKYLATSDGAHADGVFTLPGAGNQVDEAGRVTLRVVLDNQVHLHVEPWCIVNGHIGKSYHTRGVNGSATDHDFVNDQVNLFTVEDRVGGSGDI